MSSKTTTRRPSTWSKRWWSPDITEKRRIFHHLQRMAKHHPDPTSHEEMKTARKAYLKAIQSAKRKAWDLFLANAKPNDIWTAKKLAFGKEPPKTPIFPNAHTPTELRDELIKGFFPPKNLPPPPLPAQAPHPDFEPVDSDTITYILKKFSNISAPGPDQIQFGIWKKVHAANPLILVKLFNPLLQFGYHPTALKKALGVVLPKPGKPDYSSTTSFRIISLLQTISKILKKLVSDRLFSLSSPLSLVHPNQCGSLPSISTADAVLSLKQEVIASQKAGMKSSTLLLDIKGGFDNIIPQTLTDKLRKHQVPSYLIDWILSFLSQRSISLLFPGSFEFFVQVETGVPQGSPLSPILFVIYVSDLHFPCPKSLILSYVDDFGLTISSPSYRTNVRILQRMYRVMSNRARSLNLTFSAPKTDLIHWRTPRDKSARCILPVIVGDLIIHPSKSVKWLGFWLQDNHSTHQHFTKRLHLAKAAWVKVRRLSDAGKGLNPRATRHLSQVLIRPTLLYSSEIFSPLGHTLRAMSTFWRKIAIWVTNCFHSTSSAAVHSESFLTPIPPLINFIQSKYAIRIIGIHPFINPASARLPPHRPYPLV